MGLLDAISSFMNLYEVGRKTTSDVKKDNKPEKRKYSFDIEKEVPVSRKEYKKLKESNKKEEKDFDDR